VDPQRSATGRWNDTTGRHDGHACRAQGSYWPPIAAMLDTHRLVLGKAASARLCQSDKVDSKPHRLIPGRPSCGRPVVVRVNPRYGGDNFHLLCSSSLSPSLPPYFAS